MTNTVRLAILAVTAVGALTFAATALASFEPQLVAGGAPAMGARGVTLRYFLGSREDPTSVVRIAVPKGYDLTTTAAVGAAVGSVKASIFVGDLGRAVNVSGSIRVAAPESFGTQIAACTGSTTQAAAWALTFNVAGTQLRIPVAVDTAVEKPLSDVASASLTVCLLPPDVPRGAPGRAPLGSRVLSVELSLRSLKTPAKPGRYRWRATAMPYSPQTGVIDRARIVEVQSIVVLPIALTLEAKTTGTGGSRVVRVSGTLEANNERVAGIFVTLFRNGRKIGTVSTNGEGSFRVVGRLQGGGTLTARIDQPDRDLGSWSCLATYKPPAAETAIPCRDATLAGFRVASNAVRI